MKSLRLLSRVPGTITGSSRCCRQCQARVASRSRTATPSRPFSSKTDEPKASISNLHNEKGATEILNQHDVSAEPESQSSTSTEVKPDPIATNRETDSTASAKNPVHNSNQSENVTSTRSAQHKKTADGSLKLVSTGRFRELMRCVPQPVVVVTSLEVPMEVEDESSQPEWKRLNEFVAPIPRAMTVGSFTSLTLKPRPTVMFNVNLPSSTYKAIQGSRLFNVHILADDQYGAQLADRFAKGSSRIVNQLGWNLGTTRTNLWREQWAHRQRSRPNGKKPFTPFPPEALPALPHRGVHYVLRCQLKSEKGVVNGHGLIKIDDGTAIVIGQVLDVVNPTEQQGDLSTSVALSYVKQRYRMVGETIKLPHESGKSISKEAFGNNETDGTKEVLKPAQKKTKSQSETGDGRSVGTDAVERLAKDQEMTPKQGASMDS